MSELDNIDASADVITQEAAKQKEETAKLRNQNGEQNGRVGEAIKEIEDNLLPALSETNTALEQAKASNDRATASANKTLDTLKKSPDESDGIHIDPTGTATEQAETFLSAVGESMATGKIIYSTGEWDLSEVTPRGLTAGTLRWKGEALWNFGYKQLGAMFSLGSKVGLDLDGVSAKGYDRLFYASEDYDKVGYSGGRPSSWRLESHGATGIMGNDWLGTVTIKNGTFEGPLLVMITGPWWETFAAEPDGPYPGIESALFENVTWDGFGGICIHVYKHGDITFKGCKNIKTQNTVEFLVLFYTRFGYTPDPASLLMSTTGQAINLYLSAFNVGLDQYHSASNGTVTVNDCSTDMFINDRTPTPSKYNQDQEWHAVQSRTAKLCHIHDCEFNNVIDLSYINTAWAEAAKDKSMGCEMVYTKGDVLIERVKGTNCGGPGEGTLSVNKPGGGKILDCDLTRDKSKVPELYQARVEQFSDVTSKDGYLKTKSGDVAEANLAALGLNATDRDGNPSEITRLTVRGYEVPPGGWENLVQRWGSHVVGGTEMKAYDLDGNLLWSN